MFQSANEIHRKLIRHILKNGLDYRWSIQGFGMLRLYLDKETRLHIWNPSAAVPDVSEIHDHPWDFVSNIICGSLTNELYRIIEELPEVTMLMQQIVCGPGGHSCGTPEPVKMGLVSTRDYKTGESYAQFAPAFHRTIAAPGTITIIKRRFRENTENARVCFPLGTEWVSAEPRDATPEEISPFLQQALIQMENSPEV